MWSFIKAYEVDSTKNDILGSLILCNVINALELCWWIQTLVIHSADEIFFCVTQIINFFLFQIQALENRLAEGQVFLEFERIIKKKQNADFSTAMLQENMSRNRFKDVFPYEENRVRLTPTSENKTGYINASHLSVSNIYMKDLVMSLH